MKRSIGFILILLFSFGGFAQEKYYLTFEFMKVDNDQETFYTETEMFWEKIHEQRIASGDIVGWDLWQLLPGGEDQGYQYLTVTVFDSAEKMMNAGSGILESAKMAYPNLSDEELDNRLNMAGGARDLAVRLFIESVDYTEDDYPMNLGSVATIDMMKATDGNLASYESAETNVFKPMHQKMVNAGAKGNWQLLRVLFPYGSDVYATHITVNMYDDMNQYLSAMNFDTGMSDQQVSDMEKKRDMRWVYLATLVRKVR